MDKEKYMELYDNDADIELTDKDIVEWLDNLIVSLTQAQHNAYDLCWGTIKDGFYTNEICLCRNDYTSIHIHRGLDRLAKAVGEKVYCKPRSDSDYPYEFYFNYRNAHIFEIRGDKNDD